MHISLRKQNQPLITRFAPSPTGWLHLGHLASMAFVYGIARAAKAALILRIEDHDQGRSRREFEQAIFEDLNWLGFKFDDQPPPDKPHPLRQSNRHKRYLEVIDELAKAGHIYRCVCTRAMIQKQMVTGKPGVEDTADELWYAGTCRTLDHSALKSDFGLRMLASDREFVFTDGILGRQSQTPSRQCGDFLLRERGGHFTYQFAVAVDDYEQNINLIVRGEDILHSTGRQILTAERLGRQLPAQFVHHPLIRDSAGQKLGKRFFSEALAKRRTEGARPEDLIGEALAAVGLIPAANPVSADELHSFFDIGYEP